MYTTLRTPSRQTLSLPRTLRPRLGFERRERGFGVGYGNSSGYANGRSYAPAARAPRFRVS